MDSNFEITHQMSVILGDEFDEDLRNKLMALLHQLGAIQTRGSEHHVSGSQYIEKLTVNIGGKTLEITAETYIGLSIKGSKDIVQQIQKLMT